MKHRHSTAAINWTPQMLRYLREQYPLATHREIGQALGIGHRTVGRKARDLGLVALRTAAQEEAARRAAQKIASVRAAQEAQRRQQLLVGIVPAALASRTPIEIAVQRWRCGAS